MQVKAGGQLVRPIEPIGKIERAVVCPAGDDRQVLSAAIRQRLRLSGTRTERMRAADVDLLNRSVEGLEKIERIGSRRPAVGIDGDREDCRQTYPPRRSCRCRWHR